MKYKRQEEIKDIINKFNVETQTELMERLRARGIVVGQATISRDIRELNLVKVPSGVHTFKYAVPVYGENVKPSKYYSILRETITHIDTAQNLIIVKTIAGMAQAAAAAVDELGWNEIAGCIAGDDTIFLAMRSFEKAVEYSELLQRYIRMKFYDNEDFD